MDETTFAGVHNRKFVNQRRTTNAERKERQRRKGRRRHDKHQEEEDDEEEEEWQRSERREEVLPKWKLCLVGAAIFLCFALLYPSVFAPMLSNLFGGGAARRQQSAASTDQTAHPSMMGPNQQQQQRDHAHRPPPHHPGASMRMPDMHQPQQQQHGGFWGGKSGGSMAWMLPFYTVGVVCFLLYTLFKSKNKRQKRRRDLSYGLLSGEEEEEDDEGTEDGMEYGVRGAKLRSVQNRLRKTEKAMADILNQLDQFSTTSQQIMVTKTVEQKVSDPNMTNDDDADRQGKENAEQQKQQNETPTNNDGTLKPQPAMSEKQYAEVKHSLRELNMLSELCRSDRRLRQKLRAKQRQQNHSSASSTNSDSEVEEKEEDEEEQSGEMGEEEANDYDDEEEEWTEEEEEVKKTPK